MNIRTNIFASLCIIGCMGTSAHNRTLPEAGYAEALSKPKQTTSTTYTQHIEKATTFKVTKKTASPRETVNFNREWKYARGDFQYAESPSMRDDTWESIGLPHSFSMPYFMSKDFYTGYGWYRKYFTLSSVDLKKKLFLEFDGVFQEVEIYINGKLAGSHIGGYTGFSIDISSYVKEGHNLVAIRVNNLWKPDVAPRAGEHVFSGGIYRNVRLVKKEPVYIAWYGTSITTPDLEANGGKSAIVHISTDVCNQTGSVGKFILVTEIKDNNDRLVTRASSTSKIGSGNKAKIKQATRAITNPHLWSPEQPTLYKAVSLLYKDGQLLDRYETTFGFRWFKWTADKGFFLNGIHRFFKGANVHQDQAGWGDAVTETAMQRDVEMMKEAGFDFIRGSHYPHAPAFTKACDEVGMLFWSEAPFWGIGGFKPDGYWDSSAYPVNAKDTAKFEASALQQLEEMIHIHRNHPSIIAWSMCNEAFFSAPSAMPGVRRLLKRMVTLSHQLDPSRPAAIGGSQRPLGNERIDRIGDIGGYNGDGSTLPDFQNPGIPNVVSEYGSTTADRPGEYAPGWGDLKKDDGWIGRSWRSGQAIWCGFDHGSIAGSSLGKMGIVDYFRIQKRAWYWYRNEYKQIAPPEWAKEGVPAKLKLKASRTSDILADGTDDVLLTVTILDSLNKEISNSPDVTLKLVSGPGEFPTGPSITFSQKSDIRIADGKAAITFRSYYAGTAVIEATSPELQPSRITISFTGAPQYVEGQTPAAAERPYTRYVCNKQTTVIQTFGCNNPTFASSQRAQHTAGLAADGNTSTWWEATSDDQSPSWILDTEKALALEQIKLQFPREYNYRYVVEVSDDRNAWVTVLDKRNNTANELKEEILFTGQQEKPYGRFIRIRFVAGTYTALAEVEVSGIVRQ
ncbi:MAG: discoidin domain-containing protein [Bacteroides sp.]|jgi:hypothetical protein|nr:discoidin domain-containing protein [Bacteroides sp.]MCI1683534.1 discoidin domain-containing protein [Bacteroides sp.]